jgi:hypothetical protein
MQNQSTSCHAANVPRRELADRKAVPSRLSPCSVMAYPCREYRASVTGAKVGNYWHAAPIKFGPSAHSGLRDRGTRTKLAHESELNWCVVGVAPVICSPTEVKTSPIAETACRVAATT